MLIGLVGDVLAVGVDIAVVTVILHVLWKINLKYFLNYFYLTNTGAAIFLFFLLIFVKGILAN